MVATGQVDGLPAVVGPAQDARGHVGPVGNGGEAPGVASLHGGGPLLYETVQTRCPHDPLGPGGQVVETKGVGDEQHDILHGTSPLRFTACSGDATPRWAQRRPQRPPVPADSGETQTLPQREVDAGVRMGSATCPPRTRPHRVECDWIARSWNSSALAAPQRNCAVEARCCALAPASMRSASFRTQPLPGAAAPPARWRPGSPEARPPPLLPRRRQPRPPGPQPHWCCGCGGNGRRPSR